MKKQKTKMFSLLLLSLFAINSFIANIFVCYKDSYLTLNNDNYKVYFSEKNSNFIKKTYVFNPLTSKELKITINGLKTKESDLDFKLNYKQVVSYTFTSDSENNKSIKKSSNNAEKVKKELAIFSKKDNLNGKRDNLKDIFIYQKDIFLTESIKKEGIKFDKFNSRAPPILFIS
ncbi:MAG: hypothetical protein PHF46_05070 [Candidatus Gracilibacteria bacterium]|nr:hypothetical protein [Candidatus Gracilibacteria bacterium]MDD3120749.1 hypothetical protein [Candidatus Gracilibacteria bacterium]MDD4530984.1 hypothetical protein [Candidatus Gracilibacteria bacterium]